VTDRRALEANLYQRLSAWASIIALGMIVTGVVLGCIGARGAFIPQLTRYTFGDRGPGVGNVRSQLPAALHSDLWLIAAYGMVLAGCALFYRARASSELGGRIANFVVAAVFVAVAADWIEDRLLSMTLTQVPESASLRTAIAAAATIKVCAISVASVGLVASVGIVLRGAMGAYQAYAWNRSQGMALPQMLRLLKLFQSREVGAGDGSQPKPWWEEVLAPQDLTVPAATDDAVKDSVETAEARIENQQSWVRAYNVPGVAAALKDRTKPHQAL
jgi:hypothetical protein